MVNLQPSAARAAAVLDMVEIPFVDEDTATHMFPDDGAAEELIPA